MFRVKNSSKDPAKVVEHLHNFSLTEQAGIAKKKMFSSLAKWKQIVNINSVNYFLVMVFSLE